MPPAPFLGRILFRSAIAWVGLRVSLFLLFALVAPSAGAACAIVGIVALLTVLDGRHRNFHIFLANVGIPSWSVAAVATAVPLGAELTVLVLA